MTLTITELDALPPIHAAEQLRACCGASAWVAAMLVLRPFRTREALLRAADDVWSRLTAADWHEAFSHHHRIGERWAAVAVAPTAHSWSATEQAGADAATQHVTRALAEGNRAYEARFGFIFIVCASGLRADDMLAALQRRLGNDRESELRVAAEEQRKITRLRLEKLVVPTPAGSAT